MLRKNATWNVTLDEIKLTGLKVNCCVGIYPREELVPQPLEIDLILYLDTRDAARENTLTKSVDYAALNAEIRFILQSAHFKLLETACEAICNYVLAPSPVDRPRGHIIGLELTLKKIMAFDSQVIPSIKVRRHRSEASGHYSEKPQGAGYLVYRGHDCEIFRMIVPAHSKSPYYAQKIAPAYEMPCSKGLSIHGKELYPGVGLSLPAGFIRSYENPTECDRSILCILNKDEEFEIESISDGEIPYTPVPESMIKPYMKSEGMEQSF